MTKRRVPTSGNDSKTLLIVDGYGASIGVDRGHLNVTQGSFGDTPPSNLKIARGRSHLSRLIIRAPVGSISLSAIDWCNRMNIPIAFLGSDSRLLNCLMPDQAHDGPIKRAQALAGTTDSALGLARWLLKWKFDSQVTALQRDFTRFPAFKGREAHCAQAVREIKGCEELLQADSTLVALLSREAQAAQAYWRVLAGTSLPWPEWTKRRIPDHWLTISPRSTGRRLMREATDPFNAMLNYGYTLLAIEGRVTCAASGLDPDLGLLHVDERLRESFVYDLIEPARVKADVLAFEFANRKGLRPWMFHELRDGVVRLDPDLARDLAQFIMPMLRQPLADVASGYVSKLRGVDVRYVLQRPSRFFAPTAKKQTTFTNCEYCKKQLPKKGLKFCGRECYLRHSVEVRQPIKLARAKLEAMRQETGVYPGHGGEAAKKRGANISLSNKRRARTNSILQN
jgi:CRISPR-associated endonuclease Cas1